MKTPMQELIKQLKISRESAWSQKTLETTHYAIAMGDVIELAEYLLKKEKEVINNAYSDGVDNGRCLYECEDYYKETFNTNEK